MDLLLPTFEHAKQGKKSDRPKGSFTIRELAIKCGLHYSTVLVKINKLYNNRKLDIIGRVPAFNGTGFAFLYAIIDQGDFNKVFGRYFQ